MAAKTKRPEAPEAFSEIMKSAQSAMSMNPMLTPRIEQFWKAQEKMLSEAEAFTRDWFERRHEATRTALNTARQAASADKSDPATAMQAVTDWQRHSAERLIEDAREWLDMVSRCAVHAAENEAEAGKEMVEKTVEKAK